jgi:hypothetical protein
MLGAYAKIKDYQTQLELNDTDDLPLSTEQLTLLEAAAIARAYNPTYWESSLQAPHDKNSYINLSKYNYVDQLSVIYYEIAFDHLYSIMTPERKQLFDLNGNTIIILFYFNKFFVVLKLLF